ncbi:RNA-binding protein [Angomonas deanei]|uniref:RNA recognition motif. (A.k.a. RRM, RBD, or RNP domain), putative n=1 Tax=Angomonas deanei TaxID=59799 RepID=A0A7G2CDM6_9TRYP|nr:RNA-binding protein [Angomonas deanei]CAD2217940.1 RNA recognition motif. (a.k.a. RRM, RBD, or RNP domain), putative [Angomonas deanei]|eukprot:EPY39662.1 RNA-binding protein [Angomonas deanei]
MTSEATLFVSNLSRVANSQYLERLFSTYGDVKQVEMFGQDNSRFAEVTFSAIDDADAAIAALHYRYYSTRDLPLIVLYSNKSQCVSEYGRRVGVEFVEAVEKNRFPEEIPLENFDVRFGRNEVQPPPSEREIIPDPQGGVAY